MIVGEVICAWVQESTNFPVRGEQNCNGDMGAELYRQKLSFSRWGQV